jgi:hypothetical protein
MQKLGKYWLQINIPIWVSFWKGVKSFMIFVLDGESAEMA